MHDRWQKAILPFKSEATAHVYRSFIERHVATHAVGLVPLQKVRATDLEALYRTRTLAANSLQMLHSVIRQALDTAVRDRLIHTNQAAAVRHRHKPSKDRSESARQHCWSAKKARAVRAAASTAGTQTSAFIALALDTGTRRQTWR